MDIDAAYRTKYGRYGSSSVDAMVSARSGCSDTAGQP